MRLAVRREPFDHPDWLFELKWDGFRSLLEYQNGATVLISRNAHLYKSFETLRQQLCRELAHLGAATLDGELVCLDSAGCPQFDRLFYRRDTPYFCAFDILSLDGRDLRGLPLIERKQILRAVVPLTRSRLLYVDHIEGRGVDLYQEVCRRDLEGVVAKWKHGAYVSGDQTSWIKLKNPSYSQTVGRWERFQRKQAQKYDRPAILATRR